MDKASAAATNITINRPQRGTAIACLLLLLIIAASGCSVALGFRGDDVRPFATPLGRPRVLADGVRLEPTTIAVPPHEHLLHVLGTLEDRPTVRPWVKSDEFFVVHFGVATTPTASERPAYLIERDPDGYCDPSYPKKCGFELLIDTETDQVLWFQGQTL